MESLICHPATMTHAAMDEAAQAVAGIGKGLLRVSVGIECADDLVADLRQALPACRAPATGQSAHSADVVPIGSVVEEPGAPRTSIGRIG